jgi:hypothetical protein
MVVDRQGAGNRGMGSGEWSGEDHRVNAGSVKGEMTYVGSRDPRGKRKHGIFHPRLLKRTDVFCQGEGNHSDHTPQEGRKLDLSLRQAGMTITAITRMSISR